MKEIDHRSRMLEQFPSMTPPIIHHLEYNGMADYGDQTLLGTGQKIIELEADTNNFLQKLVSIIGSLPDKSEPLSFEEYISEVNYLQKNILQTLIRHYRNGKNRGAGP